ncbi:hypothetical protein CCACVL1_14077 [Corchorus capsularis]|uniref:Uncharacterized protein n=1 Tax=Corchorus capsularis TaxID=210143 RepID=A0A1R3I8C4_COCAP|nr:hypothetical protein CCACVL1_14077 [Corchorus capsularis]
MAMKRLMVIVLLLVFLLLVSGDDQKNEESMFAAMNVHSQGGKKNQTVNQKPQPQQRLRHSFDFFFSSKRRVPNASDPLHNR